MLIYAYILTGICFAAGLSPAAPSRLRMIRLYPTQKTTWNHANEICSDEGYQMLTMDSVDVTSAIKNFNANISLWNGELRDFWHGLHDYNPDPDVTNYVWVSSCEPLGDYKPLSMNDNMGTKLCVRSKSSLTPGDFWERRDCSKTDGLVICEKEIGSCFFTANNDKLVDISAHVSLRNVEVPGTGVGDCQAECRSYFNGTECWAFYFTDRQGICVLNLGDSYTELEDAMVAHTGVTTYTKHCFLAEMGPVFNTVLYDSEQEPFKGCTYQGTITDGETTLSETRVLSDTTLSDATALGDTTLSDTTVLSDTPLSDTTSFSDTTLSDATALSDTTLSDTTPLSDTTLSGATALSDTTLSDGTALIDTTLSDTTALSYTTLSGATALSDTTLSDTTALSDTTLGDTTVLSDTPTDGYITLRDTTVLIDTALTETTSLSDTTLSDTTVLSDSTISDTTVLSDTTLSDTTVLNDTTLSDTTVPSETVLSGPTALNDPTAVSVPTVLSDTTKLADITTMSLPAILTDSTIISGTTTTFRGSTRIRDETTFGETTMTTKQHRTTIVDSTIQIKTATFPATTTANRANAPIQTTMGNVTKKTLPSLETTRFGDNTTQQAITYDNQTYYRECRIFPNLTKQQKRELIEEILTNLTIDKSKVSKMRRKYMSAEDPRPSVKTVGIAGMVGLSLASIGLFLLDYGALAQDIINTFWQNLKASCR